MLIIIAKDINLFFQLAQRRKSKYGRAFASLKANTDSGKGYDILK